jgi:pyridinium-3,5-biscarboxylic acid mononucleotide synthase
MDKNRIAEILEQYKQGALDLAQAMDQFKSFPYENIEFARVDHHRHLRQGFPEVVFGQGKSDSQIAGIVGKLLRPNNNVLITRVGVSAYEAVQAIAADAEYHALARLITIKRQATLQSETKISVVSAGTADLPVAEEAAITAEIIGNEVERIYDVGVAGLHRLLGEYERLRRARVIVCVAGMEGALPSVLGGLVDVPVIAVPTSIGYGTAFGGLTALLGMLNSCSSNVVVVNIDNGFGAGFAASLINRGTKQS